ncbi:HEAT repeat domain-containing protein [Streptomyces ipomoeae]|uniref:HEAT repeat domain-containing protein n=1 Tax=Streptomyces ipomoeae TaxID=103232 RepID=UPI0015F0C4F4|nr:HEAT repeat domain-containing protein [Streptomyces ipomoeae]MDX2935575.1 HEAT repeat domain-containing protein [Streptomyces ipomoeae]
MLEHLDKVHADNGTKSQRVIAREMGLSTPTRVGAMLRGISRPADLDQLDRLVKALGGSQEDIREARRRYAADEKERVAHRGTSMDEEVRGYLAAARKAAEKHPYLSIPEPPSLDTVYVRQHSRPAARDGHTVPGDGSAAGGSGTGLVVPSEPAEAVFRKADRVCVLIAGPGTGKSTLLHARLRDAAGELLDNTHHPAKCDVAVPVWVSAHAFTGEETQVPDVLAGATGKLSQFGRHQKLTRDRFLQRPWTGAHWQLLVDDLDELPNAHERRVVLEKLANAVAAEPSLYRCVVATRPLAEGELNVLDHVLGLKAPHYELQPFTPHDLHAYMEKYFRTRWLQEEATHRAHRFAGALRSVSLDELARIPLMAFMLCQLYLAKPERPLPDGRAAVYEAFTDLLYETNQSKHVAESHEESIKQLVESVQSPRARKEAEAAARHVHERLPELIGYLAHRRLWDHKTPVTEALASHEAVQRPSKIRPERWEAFLENLLRHTGLLVHRVDGLGFPHQTFLEYHAAAEIHRRLTVERSLTEDALIHQVYGKHWADSTWHETLVLLAGMVEPRLAGRIVDHLLAADPLWFIRRPGTSSDETPQHIVLAARCLGEVRDPGVLSAQCSAVVNAVIALIEHMVEKRASLDSPVTRAVAETLPPVLGRLGACNSAIGRRYHDWYRARGQFLRVMREGENFVWFEVPPAARVGAALLRDNSEFRESLVSQAVFGPDPSGRGEALLALIQEWPDDPQVAGLLREFAETDPDGDVRRGSLQLLAMTRRQDQSTREWLQTCLTDHDPHLRQGALAALADGWRNEPETFALLRQFATDDPDDSVRLTAVKSIADGWPRNPDAAVVVRDRAARDPDPHLRCQVFHILVKCWPDDPQTVALLRAIAADAGSEAWVREDAKWALARAETPPTDPAPARPTPPPAAEDPQHAALKPLVVDRRTDAETPMLLRELAAAHPNEKVRVAAVRVLATEWRTHPPTLPWLCELATSGASKPERQAALQAVGSAWPGHPDAEALLRSVAKGKGQPQARELAVLALAAGWHNNPATGSLLHRLAVDDNEDVRAAAVRTLGASWRDHPHTVVLLHDRAENDPKPYVRRTAIQALVTNFRTLRTAVLLRRLAIDDPDEHLRAAAIYDLAAGWRDPETGELLRRIVTSQTDPISRGAAIRALAGGWRDDPVTEELLRERAADSSDWHLQRAAVMALAERWPYDPEIQALADHLSDEW